MKQTTKHHNIQSKAIRKVTRNSTQLQIPIVANVIVHLEKRKNQLKTMRTNENFQ